MKTEGMKIKKTEAGKEKLQTKQKQKKMNMYLHTKVRGEIFLLFFIYLWKRQNCVRFFLRGKKSRISKMINLRLLSPLIVCLIKKTKGKGALSKMKSWINETLRRIRLFILPSGSIYKYTPWINYSKGARRTYSYTCQILHKWLNGSHTYTHTQKKEEKKRSKIRTQKVFSITCLYLITFFFFWGGHLYFFQEDKWVIYFF